MNVAKGLPLRQQAVPLPNRGLLQKIRATLPKLPRLQQEATVTPQRLPKRRLSKSDLPQAPVHHPSRGASLALPLPQPPLQQAVALPPQLPIHHPNRGAPLTLPSPQPPLQQAVALPRQYTIQTGGCHCHRHSYHSKMQWHNFLHTQ